MKLRLGDRILIYANVIEDQFGITVCPEGTSFNLPRTAVNIHSIVPEPLKAGEEVLYRRYKSDTPLSCKLIAISDGKAWVNFSDGVGFLTVDLSTLSRK